MSHLAKAMGGLNIDADANANASAEAKAAMVGQVQVPKAKHGGAPQDGGGHGEQPLVKAFHPWAEYVHPLAKVGGPPPMNLIPYVKAAAAAWPISAGWQGDDGNWYSREEWMQHWGKYSPVEWARYEWQRRQRSAPYAKAS
jgi:hypothetical protein